MHTYRVPGVYFEWLDTARAIEGTRTDIAGFIGIAARGPLHTPVKVESWSQFLSVFGAHSPNGYLAYAVEGFFTNGGATCWVVRVADPAKAAPGTLDIPSAAAADPAALVLGASSPGTWSAALRVSIIRTTADRFTMLLRLPDGVQESWRGLSMQPPSIDLFDSAGDPVLRLAISDPCLWNANLSVKLTQSNAATFTLTLFKDGAERTSWPDLVMDPKAERYAPKLIEKLTPTLAQARNLSDGGPGRTPDPSAPNLRNGSGPLVADARFIGNLLNDQSAGSQLVRVTRIHHPAYLPDNLPDDAMLPAMIGGTDGLSTLTLNHFTGDAVRAVDRWGLATLEAVGEVRVIAMPDAVAAPSVTVPPPHTPRDCTKLVKQPPDTVIPAPDVPPNFGAAGVAVLQQAMVRHCETLKDRTCILDPPRPDLSPMEMFYWRKEFDSSYAALYFPWIGVTDPRRGAGLVRAVPPCGHVAGVYARGDLRIGVHKPPANELVEGAKDVTFAVDDVDHGGLNDVGVNVIRAVNGRGIRIAGARTLSSDTLLLYLNVRRLLIMIEQSIDQACQWTVFEPNNRDLWREIVRLSRSFLDRLWKRGMLDGATAAEAYSVTCDETTNPPERTDNGLMVCELGVLPPWPAEFVVVRIGKTEDSTEILETTGVGRG